MATHEYRIHVKARPGRNAVDPGRVQQFINSEPGVVRELMRRADRASDYQRRNCGRRTGRLAATARTQLATSRGNIAAQAIIGRDGVTPYLGYVMYGTGPHVIRPSRAKALRFVSGGSVRFATRVNHPGNRANPFVLESVAAAAG
ncbi:MAG: hypothetical protein L0I76_29540 [Pseudonocardia sp.]|nr:hypothetical protein [Pseudonocardia sp.]